MPPAQVRGWAIKVLKLRCGIKVMSLGDISMTSWFLYHSVYIGLSFELNMINGDKSRVSGLMDEGRHHLLQLPDRRLVHCGRFGTGTWMLLLLAVPLL